MNLEIIPVYLKYETKEGKTAKTKSCDKIRRKSANIWPTLHLYSDLDRHVCICLTPLPPLSEKNLKFADSAYPIGGWHPLWTVPKANGIDCILLLCMSCIGGRVDNLVMYHFLYNILMQYSVKVSAS